MVEVVAEDEDQWNLCDECGKWRRMPRGVNVDNLSAKWDCYKEPLNGSCNIPEETVGCALIVTFGSTPAAGGCGKFRVDYTDNPNLRAKPSGSKNMRLQASKKTEFLQQTITSFFPRGTMNSQKLKLHKPRPPMMINISVRMPRRRRRSTTLRRRTPASERPQ